MSRVTSMLMRVPLSMVMVGGMFFWRSRIERETSTNTCPAAVVAPEVAPMVVVGAGLDASERSANHATKKLLENILKK